MSCPSTIIDEWLRNSGAADFNPSGLVLIGLGANLDSSVGSPDDTLRAAVTEIQQLSDFPVLVSQTVQTRPVDCPPGSPDYSNAVAVLIPGTGQLPEDFLRDLQRIERLFGRVRSGVRNEARPLDLDLLAFGQERRDTDFLCLPHPRAHQRSFVLEPLASIWPDYVFPGQTATARALLIG